MRTLGPSTKAMTVALAILAATALSTESPLGSRAQVAVAVEAALHLGVPPETMTVWVFFTDGIADQAGFAAGRVIDGGYLERIARSVTRVGAQSRWLNAVRVEATRAQIDVLSALPFVARVDVVSRIRQAPDYVDALPAAGPSGAAPAGKRRG